MTQEDVRNYPWHHITVEDAEAYRQLIWRRHQPQSSRNDRISIVRRVIHQCYVVGLISALRRELLFGELFTVAVGDSQKKRRLTADEVVALMNACETMGDAKTRARNTAIVALFRTSGMRIGELAKLDLSDLNLEQGTALLRETKNGRDHLVYLHPTAVDYLHRWLHFRGDRPGALFSPSIGTEVRHLTTETIRFMLRSRADVAGIPRFDPHDFRRTFATDLLERVDPVLVSRLMNHRKIESTMIYDQRGDDAKRAAVGTLSLPNLGALNSNGDNSSANDGERGLVA